MKGKNKGQMSFGEIRELVCNAICAKESADFSCYIEDIFPDSVVYESVGKDGVEKCYQRSYSITDGQVTLGDPVEVQKEISYMPMQGASQIIAAVGEKGSEEYGYVWHVQVNKYGPGKDGRINWTREPLVAAIPLIEGARVFALNESQHQAASKPFGKSVKEIVGWLKNVSDTGTAIEADFFILKSASWLRDGLVDSFERGKPDLFGLSFDALGSTVTKMVAGRKMKEPVKISAVEVDVVYDPTNDGKFIRMAAAVGQEEEQMLQKLLAALQKTRPDLHKEITEKMTAGTLNDDQAIEMIAAATVKEAGGDETNAKLVASVVTNLTAAFTTQTENETVKEMKLLACGMKLDAALTASNLPDASQNHIRLQFEKRVFEETELQAAIKGMKEMVDQLTASGQVTGLGGVRVGYESSDKLQAAFDGMFGVKVEGDLAGIKPFRSLRAAYVEMTGDHDVTGVITPDNFRRLQAAYGDTSFAYVLGNTLYRRMAQDYREISDYGVSLLVGNNIRNAVDFRKLETIRIGYYGDLPAVDTDTEDYPDLGEVTDEQVEYALAERGGIITIKRRTLINDDMRLVDRIVSRLGRGARRGLARVVWTPFLTNATYKGDNKAIFHADHGNLGSAAYAIASALAGRNAMRVQTEPNSGERLNLRPVTVAFPTELFGIVSNVNSYQPQAVTVDNANSMYQYFRPERLFENPFMIDANDWLMLADPNEVEIVELAFLNGQQDPQMFIANMPTQGQMFLNGAIQYKIQHDYNAEVVDFRGAYKGVVA